ncbi:hypothetical protein HY450_01680 [Candidatus Pacearchaeota archaeon]|nr:hypothetical protein [Candidatus Pacearchaeota archaeon]
MDICEELRKISLNLGDIVEVNLFKGVKFNRLERYPYSYGSEMFSKEKGKKIVGYVIEFDRDCIDMSPSNDDGINLGQFSVYSNAIFSLRKV